MSSNKNVNINKTAGLKPKKKREPASKIAVRVIAMVLVLLMLAGSLYMVLQFLFLNIHAQEYDSGLMLRAGLMYGDGVTVGFETAAEHGFSLGYVDSSNKYTALTQVSDTALSVTCDCNLSSTNRTFAKTDSPNPAVGGYHIEISAPNLYSFYAAVAGALAECGYAPFPAYINGEFRIRAGSFGTAAAAQTAVSALPDSLLFTISSLSGKITAASPSPTAVTAVSPDTNSIVFELDSADRSIGLGMEALQIDGADTAFMITPAKNKYEGVFEFQRNFPAYKDGVALTNIVTLEQYTAGVLPYEIGPNWPLEAQKAFAIAVRSYALSHLNKHYKSYGFDVCNGTDCQVFRGVGSATDTVRRAVAETAGQVMTYNGSIVSAFFSSSSGGTTVSAADAWGSKPESYPYLAAKATPWEHYAEHANGEWTSEVTPTELYNTLRAKGYTLLRGPIINIVINSTAENSTYVTSITFYDIYGTPVTVTLSDKIRSVLGAYVRSANFRVASAGQTVALTDYYYADAADMFGVSGISGTKSAISAATGYAGSGLPANFKLPSSADPMGKQSVSGGEPALKVVTSSGQAAAVIGGALGAVTSGGFASVKTGGGSLITLTSTGVRNFILPDESELNRGGSGGTQSTLLPRLSSLAIASSTRYVTAAGASGSFVFVGRGYGHGVGMSQWGTYDLAMLGYGCSEILDAYYTGTVITDYRMTAGFNGLN